MLGMSRNITSLGFFNFEDCTPLAARAFAALAAGGIQLKDITIELTIREEERWDDYDDGEDEYDAPERYRLRDAGLSDFKLRASRSV
jgi:hypothetical protein